jgi:hypothetical protein
MHDTHDMTARFDIYIYNAPAGTTVRHENRQLGWATTGNRWVLTSEKGEISPLRKSQHRIYS